MKHWTHWLPARKQSLPYDLREWLTDTGSLTKRLQHVSEHAVNVELLHYDWQTALPEESLFLQQPLQRIQLGREVLLCDGDTPEIYARTIIPQSTYQVLPSRFDNLGVKPLGQMLFDEPSLSRSEIQVAQLTPQHWLYQLATEALDICPDVLWARRSCFYLKGQPVLVCEIFLPSEKWSHV
ncbi:MAG: chorismate--pyruvate lyase [Methylophaga sp.]|uniref:Probable chorismate pyruvate-lyase n=2 Tax=Methylophaga TaxID=40222 RepID=A0ABN0TNQ0_9GAMM|nr:MULTISPECIES: chorismate lyase [Methylophaga]MAX52411.1 chorismate--pyruvate lyase [Methylophaga sp.]BDZ74460.1 putative chorismate pyruvate-lyase [Methylophaga marina]|tara:strand:- start:160163 stop:160705 length:543 start_codon:yes stop_codon:yes gene_type:complete